MRITNMKETNVNKDSQLLTVTTGCPLPPLMFTSGTISTRMFFFRARIILTNWAIFAQRTAYLVLECSRQTWKTKREQIKLVVPS